ncbi:MAG: serine hydrolase [Acidimicrobiales bacterium]|nr:serine hydrolase [Acidimicrobiales bacterium]
MGGDFVPFHCTATIVGTARSWEYATQDPSDDELLLLEPCFAEIEAVPTTTLDLPTPNFDVPENFDSFNNQLQGEFGSSVDTEFAALADRAGITVGVFTDGTLWTYALGIASEAVPMTTSTPTLIRSTSKTFESAVILELIEDGHFQLTDSLESVLSAHPDYSSLDRTKVNVAVTIHELLSMRSGIRPYQSGNSNNPDLLWAVTKPSWKPADTLAIIEEPWVAPGEYEYSDSNNYLLGMAAELHSGKDLPVLYRERFFDPLGIAAVLLPDEALPEGTARPHGDLAEWGGSGWGDLIENDTQNADWHGQDSRLAWATASIVSTPANMARWGYELYSNNGSAISNQSRSILLNSFEDELVTFGGLPQRYGYWVAKRSFPLADGTSLEVIGHQGGGGGYTSQFLYSPDLDLSISVLLNQGLRSQGSCLDYSPLDCISWEIFKAYAE